MKPDEGQGKDCTFSLINSTDSWRAGHPALAHPKVWEGEGLPGCSIPKSEIKKKHRFCSHGDFKGYTLFVLRLKSTTENGERLQHSNFKNLI
jgi:hypothetical protein